MNLHGARPINDPAIKKFISCLNIEHDLYNNELQEKFIEHFFSWINSSCFNSLIGLDSFTNRRLTAGTSQIFDHFYLNNKNKRSRFYKGEFMYHSACLKNNSEWCYIEDDIIRSQDAVIVSVPFSDWGSQRPINQLLEQCETLHIPVLLDFAYYPCARNINMDINSWECIDTVAFSISKAFNGAEFLRVGLRLQRKDNDDGIDVFNSVGMINRVSISIAQHLISNYSVDYNWKTYEKYYNLVCNQLNLKKTDCIMFGLGGDEYQDYNRGGSVNRVCVSDIIGEKLNGNSK
jgi:hypothetical protein